MRFIPNIEASDATFNFEPPVPIRDDEPSGLSLARLATIAWYGTEFPRGLADQTCEEGFLELFDEVSQSPQLIAQEISNVLRGKHLVTVTK